MTIFKRIAISGAAIGLLFGALPALANDNHIGADIKANVKAKVAAILRSNVSINANGQTVVNGATVTAVSGSTISASTKLGDATLNWTVVANDDTKFSSKGNGLADVMVGDKLNFHGALTGNLSVKASSIKDLTPPPVRPSLSPKPVIRSTVEGKIVTTSPLVIKVGDVNYTVNVASDTSVLNVFWLHTALTNLRVDDSLRVYGSVNTADHTINATVIRDTSIRL